MLSEVAQNRGGPTSRGFDLVTICAYSLIGANSSQLAPNVENLVPNFWTYINGTVSRSLALLASR